MALNLGDVSFDLTADTSGLDSAQRAMKQFADQAEQTARKIATSGKNVESSFKGIEGAIDSANKVLGAFGAALTVGSIVGFVRNVIDSTAKLSDQAAQLHINVESLQELIQTGNDFGVSQEQMVAGLERFTHTIGEASIGGTKAAAEFKALGINIKDAQGNIRPTVDILKNVSDVLAKMPDVTRRAVIEAAFFGKGMEAIDTTLKSGSATLEKYMQDQKDAGKVIGEDTVADLKKAQLAIDDFTTHMKVMAAGFISGVGDMGDALGAFIVNADRYFGVLFTTPLGQLESSIASLQSRIADLNKLDTSLKTPGTQAVVLQVAALNKELDREIKLRDRIIAQMNTEQAAAAAHLPGQHATGITTDTLNLSAFGTGGTGNADRLAQALKNVNDQLNDAVAEYAALTLGADAYKKAVTETAIDKTVDSMVQSLVKAGDSMTDAAARGEQLRSVLEKTAALKPYVQLVDEIEQTQARQKDLSRGVLTYEEELIKLRTLGPEALLQVQKALGDQGATLKQTAKDWANLNENVRELDKADTTVTNMLQTLSDMKVETSALSGSWEEATRYMKDPALYNSLNDYYEALLKISHGSTDYADKWLTKAQDIIDANTKIKDSYQRTADFINNVTDSLNTAFSDLGNTIVNAFVTGKLQAQDFMNILQNLVAQIMQAIIQMTIIQPLMDALKVGLGGIFGSSGPGVVGGTVEDLINVTGAKGLVIDNSNVVPMARGGILRRPSIIPLASGGALVGEAGTEAVMPLKRTSSGDLGVIASGMGGFSQTVNIINNASPDVNVSTRSSKDGRGNIDLEILVSKVVSKDIRSGGPVAQSIGTMFSSTQRVVSR